MIIEKLKNSKYSVKAFLSIVLCVVLALSCFTACGADGKNGQDAQSGAEILGDNDTSISETFMGENTDSEQVWAGTQYYNGEAVNLWRQTNSTHKGENLLDVFLVDTAGNSKRIVSNAPGSYTGKWFYTAEGYCLTYSVGKLARIEADGTEKYSVKTEDGINGIVQLEDGTIVLLLKDEEMRFCLATLDPKRGKIKKVSGLDLGTDSRISIGTEGNTVLIFDRYGIWDVDMKKGERTERIPIEDYDYDVEYTVKTFRLLDGACVELLYMGCSDVLLPREIDKYRTVITVLNQTPMSQVQSQLDNFNKSQYAYYAKEITYDRAAFNASCGEILMQAFAEGTAPDIILERSFDSTADIVLAIEKGYLEDLKPYMDSTGVYEENYFPGAFDGYKLGDKIYSASSAVNAMGLLVKESVLGNREIPNMETLVNALLAYDEPAYIAKHPFLVLDMFLEASDSLCGAVDWENLVCNFNSDLFASVLEVSEIYGNSYGEDVPCVMKTVSTGNFYHYLNEEQRQLSGVVYIGYLFDDGSYPGLNMEYSTYMMNSASADKEAAWAVLDYLLSEESQLQKGLTWKDDEGMETPLLMRNCPSNIFSFDAVVLQEREETSLVRLIIPTGWVVAYKGGSSQEANEIGEAAYRARYDLKDEDVEEILALMYQGRHFPKRTSALQSIIKTEALPYFNGEIELGEACDNIQKKAQEYLDSLK